MLAGLRVDHEFSRDSQQVGVRPASSRLAPQDFCNRVKRNAAHDEDRLAVESRPRRRWVPLQMLDRSVAHGVNQRILDLVIGVLPSRDLRAPKAAVVELVSDASFVLLPEREPRQDGLQCVVSESNGHPREFARIPMGLQLRHGIVVDALVLDWPEQLVGEGNAELGLASLEQVDRERHEVLWICAPPVAAVLPAINDWLQFGGNGCGHTRASREYDSPDPGIVATRESAKNFSNLSWNMLNHRIQVASFRPVLLTHDAVASDFWFGRAAESSRISEWLHPMWIFEPLVERPT